MISEICKKAPLIHAITNPISINACANLTLALGARPIMAEHPREILEIAGGADALLINLGNITDARRKSALKMIGLNKKCVLDLVGISCSTFRFNLARKLIKKRVPEIIKGNYSEIAALINGHKTRGVDAENITEEEVISCATKLAVKCKTVILASGKVDIVTDGKRLYKIKNGTERMGETTGTGCMLGMFCACMLSVNTPLEAAKEACIAFGICGEESGDENFEMNLIGNVRKLTDEKINKMKRVEEYEA